MPDAVLPLGEGKSPKRRLLTYLSCTATRAAAEVPKGGSVAVQCNGVIFCIEEIVRCTVTGKEQSLEVRSSSGHVCLQYQDSTCRPIDMCVA